MTWDEIYERADGKGYGSDELTAKDNARAAVRNLVLDIEDIDIEDAECPEDEVEYYAKRWHLHFDESGNIVCMEKKAILIEDVKAFAYSQLGKEDAKVSVTDGEFNIVDPWYSPTKRKELTNEEAILEWGEDLVEEFINKAIDYLAHGE